MDLKTVKDRLKVVLKKIDETQESIALLKNECQAKGIDPQDSSHHAEEEVLSLQSRVESQKIEVNIADKLKWEFEQSISKRVAALDQYKREFNRLLIDIDSNEDANRLRRADIQLVPALIQVN